MYFYHHNQTAHLIHRLIHGASWCGHLFFSEVLEFRIAVIVSPEFVLKNEIDFAKAKSMKKMPVLSFVYVCMRTQDKLVNQPIEYVPAESFETEIYGCYNFASMDEK